MFTEILHDTVNLSLSKCMKLERGTQMLLLPRLFLVSMNWKMFALLICLWG